MSILLSMSGGLGLFLFGMKMMSEGIERAAGAKLREILEFFTKRTIRAPTSKKTGAASDRFKDTN